MAKKYKKIILAVLAAALISSFAGTWLFVFGWAFLILPVLAGAVIISIQPENRVIKFIDKLLIGSVLYGFLALLFIYSEMYLISNFIYHSGFPFWPLYNPREYLYGSLVFAFISFLGGLTGIVVRGFYFIIRERTKNKI
jgi:hypothetical protein